MVAGTMSGIGRDMSGDPSELLTVERAAEVFGVDPEIMAAFVAKEFVPSVRGRDGVYYVRRSDVDTYLAPGRRLADDWRRRGLI